MGVVLWGGHTRRHLGHRAPRQVDLRPRNHVGLRGRGHLRVQGGEHWLARGGQIGLRDWGHCLTGGGHLWSGSPRHLHLWVSRDLGPGGQGDLLLRGQHVMMGESGGHLLAGVGQVGLRDGGCRLRRRGGLWMCSLGGQANLRPRHHVRMLLGGVALGELVPPGGHRGLEAVLLVRLQLPSECLLILGGAAGLGGHVATVRVGLLGL